MIILNFRVLHFRLVSELIQICLNWFNIFISNNNRNKMGIYGFRMFFKLIGLSSWAVLRFIIFHGYPTTALALPKYPGHPGFLKWYPDQISRSIAVIFGYGLPGFRAQRPLQIVIHIGTGSP